MKKFLIILIPIIIVVVGYFTVPILLDNNMNFKNKKITNNKVNKYNKYKELYDSIFSDNYEKAYDMMEKMSIEEKIGQLFLVRYDKNMIDTYKDYYPGGYLLFARDFEGHNSTSINDELTSISSKIPLSFAVDEEGGFVTRISRYSSFRSSKFLSPKYYYETGGYDLLKNVELEKADLLKSCGINVNLAPVADISTNSSDFIYNRSFGYDAEKTSEFISNMVDYSNEANISSCLKHFPGYGNNVDTHTGSANDSRSYDNFVNNDYKPFEAGIKSKVPMILVSHNVIESIDSSVPASLSLKIHEELRDKLGFTGIIITDDLIMDAISKVYDDGAVRAINSGNDVLISSDFINDYNKVMEAYNNKLINEEVIDKAVTRVIAWKYTYNII